MSAKPVIGVSADRRLLDPHSFHVAGEKYLTAVRDGAGGVPFIVPALGSSIEPLDILQHLDGVLLTGSVSNVEPQHYGGEPSKEGTLHDPERDATTLVLTKTALEQGVPILALCRGFQELNVVLGGTLHQLVHEVPGYGDHRERPEDPLEKQYGPAHFVNLADGGLLRSMVGEGRVEVNSLHSQAVARLGQGVIVEAVADDGLVEAFRVDSATAFALAVQWHPEWRVTENNLSMAIFQAFGNACLERKRSQKQGGT